MQNLRKFQIGLSIVFVVSLASHLAAEEEGFVPLFDGESLKGWQGAINGYEVRDGAIHCKAKSGGKIFTDREFADFELRFEFRLTPGANNGLGIRTPVAGNPAYAGMELQVLDNTAEKYAKLKKWQYHGSIYGVVPAKRGALKPVGEWNSQTVIAKGHHIKVILNGETIVDANIAEASRNGTIDGSKHPGLLNKSGHIGFLGHGSIVSFRDIRIKEL